MPLSAKAQRVGAEGAVIPLESVERVSDETLVARALDGESWALEAMYRRHARLVAGTVRRLLRDAAEAEDVVQETFLLAFERLPQLVEPAALRVWLQRIGVSLVHRRFRRQRLFGWLKGRDEQGPNLLEQAAEGLSPAERAELALFDRVLGKVAATRRTPWLLRHVSGHALEDIAVMCECSLATVKRRIAEVDALVREHIGEGVSR